MPFLSQNELVVILDELLVAQEWKTLLDYAISASHRQPSRANLDLALFHELLVNRIMVALDSVRARLPFSAEPVSSIELELTAGGEHVPIHADINSPETQGRFLSFAYFFHQEPRTSSGGDMRIFEADVTNPIPGPTGRQLVIHPLQNQIVFFDSRLPYEVLPTEYPSDDVASLRFVVNGWLRR